MEMPAVASGWVKLRATVLHSTLMVVDGASGLYLTMCIVPILRLFINLGMQWNVPIHSSRCGSGPEMVAPSHPMCLVAQQVLIRITG